MSLRFRILGSGSGGNATLVEASQGITTTQLLVDCGFSLRELTRRLALAGSHPEQLAAVFITHEHGDHIGCALAVCARYRLPLITSRGTWRAIGRDDFDLALLRLCRSAERLEVGDLALQPFAVPHDANEPLQLRLDDGAASLGIVTDLGSAPAGVSAALAHCDALLLECNHDEGLLRSGSYPAHLKRRILGSHGHLSNEAAAGLLQRLLHPRLGQLLAGHLSERNNQPALAQAALAQVLGCAADEIPVAQQATGFEWLTV